MVAVELGRISNDLRLLASGPTTGLNEILLPAVQPGSSIMPGKVNPVIPECMNMICFQVIGNDACIAHAAGAGQLELNVMMPIISFNLLWSIQILTNGVRMLRNRCVEGIEPNRERCATYFTSTLGLATVLNPVIGYHRAAEVAREAAVTGKSIRDVVLEKGLLTEDELDRLLAQSLGEDT
jgi:aspartate ammonia-lyase